MPKQILEISTLTPDRLAINIDGRLYELKDRDEMGVENLITLQKLYNEVMGVQQLSADEIDEEVGRTLAHALDKFCRLLLIDCPDDVHNKMKDHHRLQIVHAFQAAAGDVQTTTQPQNRTARRTKK